MTGDSESRGGAQASPGSSAAVVRYGRAKTAEGTEAAAAASDHAARSHPAVDAAAGRVDRPSRPCMLNWVRPRLVTKERSGFLARVQDVLSVTREVSGRVTLVKLGQPDRFFTSKGNSYWLRISKKTEETPSIAKRLPGFPFELV